MSRDRRQSFVAPKSEKDINCSGCGNTIGGDYIIALDHDWHKECFSCGLCTKTITGTFYIIDGKRKCEGCYNSSHTCYTCGRPLIGQFLQYEDGKEVHKECAPKKFCSKCNGDITGNYTDVMGKEYHPDCFVCLNCTLPLGGQSFVEWEGGPHCLECARNKGANI